MSTGLGSQKRAGTMYIGSQLDGLHALRVMLAGNSVLTHLNLSCCGLGLMQGAMGLLMDGLQENDCLTHLDLSHNHLDLGSVQTMCRVLSGEASQLSLASLNLGSNRLGSDSAAELAQCLRECQHINVLDLSDNNIMVCVYVWV
jgi:Ran GTPase-activating protein (RanGAP) involved in mRNA processing and transport